MGITRQIMSVKLETLWQHFVNTVATLCDNSSTEQLMNHVAICSSTHGRNDNLVHLLY